MSSPGVPEHTDRARERVFGDGLSSSFSDMTEMPGSDKVWMGVGARPDARGRRPLTSPRMKGDVPSSG